MRHRLAEVDYEMAARLDVVLNRHIERGNSDADLVHLWQWTLGNYSADEYADLQRECLAWDRDPEAKFLAYRYYTQRKFRYIVPMLGWDRLTAPRRVLDIGCGGGHMGPIGSFFGHEVLGLDLVGVPVFDLQCAFWGLQKVDHEIEPMQPLPDVGRFDQVVAGIAQFDIGWGVREWEFFLDRLFADHMKLGGSFITTLTGRPDRPPEVWDYLHRRARLVRESGKLLKFKG